jgi:hypothetical protein
VKVRNCVSVENDNAHPRLGVKTQDGTQAMGHSGSSFYHLDSQKVIQ